MEEEIIKYHSKLPPALVSGGFISDMFHKWIDEYEIESETDLLDLANHFSKVINYQIKGIDLVADLYKRLELLEPEKIINFNKYLQKQ